MSCDGVEWSIPREWLPKNGRRRSGAVWRNDRWGTRDEKRLLANDFTRQKPSTCRNSRAILAACQRHLPTRLRHHACKVIHPAREAAGRIGEMMPRADAGCAGRSGFSVQRFVRSKRPPSPHLQPSLWRHRYGATAWLSRGPRRLYYRARRAFQIRG